MRTHIAMLSFLLAFFMAGCGSGGKFDPQNRKSPETTEEQGAVSETEPPTPQRDAAASPTEKQKEEAPGFFSSMAARHNPNDTIHKFIRTADMKFRVKNVMDATLGIEDLVIESGGFVILSDLRSEKSTVRTIRISKDSSMEIIDYRTENYMTLRVPVEELDQVLRGIGDFSVYMDHRLIKADDIRLQLMANKLEQKRQQNYQEGVNKSGGNNVSADDRVLYSQQASDEALLRNLSLDDQMNYSTIRVLIYQDANESHHTISTPIYVEEYHRSMGDRMADAFADGWSIVQFFIVQLARVWPFIVIVLGVLCIVWLSGKKSGKS